MWKTNDWNLQQHMNKEVKLPSKFWGVICPCPWAVYRYEILKSLNIFSETAWTIFTRFHKGPSVERVLTICSNGFAPLNKMAAMLIYSKTLKNLPLQHWGWILVYTGIVLRKRGFLRIGGPILTILWFVQIRGENFAEGWRSSDFHPVLMYYWSHSPLKFNIVT